MASQVEEVAADSQRRRKARRSRGRGLRTTTGCLTCRRRRLKCSEEKPVCGQCEKSDRDCHYAQPDPASALSPSSSKRGSWGSRDAKFPLEASPTSPSASPEEPLRASSRINSTTSSNFEVAKTSCNKDVIESPSSRIDDIYQPSVSQSSFSRIAAALPDTHLVSKTTDHVAVKPSPATDVVSPDTQIASLTSPGQAPYEWWEQIAQDAVKSSDNYQLLQDSRSRWSFEPVDMSRSSALSVRSLLHSNSRQGYEEQQPTTARLAIGRGNGIGSNDDIFAKEPWNTAELPVLSARELYYLHYYIDNVGPIFDLFDPNRSFTNTIPHLAMRNVGLLKSVLAVAARFKSLHGRPTSSDLTQQQAADAQFSSTDDETSTQFYFETLGYLSQAMQYPSYTRSQEILATAALISSYEYFHIDKSTDWEKHLKGVFWIQRSQETNGEREGLPGAVWWAWLRQDIWAALWQKRQPLTIWEYTKPVEILGGQEFASRATFLLAKSIKYAYSDGQGDISQRILDGERLFRELQDWYSHRPSSYRPLPTPQDNQANDSAVFPTVWIHPTYHAAAMQNYYSAMIMLLLHKPSGGCANIYHDVPRILDEAVGMICGLAQCHAALDHPSSMVNFQALYVAGHCVRTPHQQKVLYQIFERTLDANKFPSKSLLSNLQSVWIDH